MLKKKILAVLCATCIITNLCVTSISAYDGGIPGPNILQSTHYHEDNLEYFRALSLEVMRATNSHQIDGFIEYSYDESIPVGYIYITREDFLTETPERAALKQELLESGFFHFELIDYPYEEFADIGRTMIEYMDKTDFRKLSMIPNENGKLELQFKNSGNLQESYQEILDYLAANVSNFSDDMIYFTYYDEITENIKYFNWKVYQVYKSYRDRLYEFLKETSSDYPYEFNTDYYYRMGSGSDDWSTIIYISDDRFMTDTPEHKALKQELIDSGFFSFVKVKYSYNDLVHGVGDVLKQYPNVENMISLVWLYMNDENKLDILFYSKDLADQNCLSVVNFLRKNVPHFSDDMIRLLYIDEEVGAVEFEIPESESKSDTEQKADKPSSTEKIKKNPSMGTLS